VDGEARDLLGGGADWEEAQEGQLLLGIGCLVLIMVMVVIAVGRTKEAGCVRFTDRLLPPLHSLSLFYTIHQISRTTRVKNTHFRLFNAVDFAYEILINDQDPQGTTRNQDAPLSWTA
jgi:hypothetical protein